MKLRIKHVVKDLDLVLLTSDKTCERQILSEMLSRPGVELAGFLDFFDEERLVLMGSKEVHFMNLLPVEIQKKRIQDMLEKKPPGILFSVSVDVPFWIIELGEHYGVAILKGKVRTTPLNGMLYQYLRDKLAPRKSVHGVLMDIHGLGTLIVGKSGIGKSETALELIKRGHILVSDDRVDVYEASPGLLVGHAPEILERYIEVRGIGIVDVVKMFGAGAFRESKKIKLVVELEHWKKDKQYDRLGTQTETVQFFNTEIIKVTIPVLPGNVATLVETAALNQKLKYLGYNATEELMSAVSKKARRVKGDDDED